MLDDYFNLEYSPTKKEKHSNKQANTCAPIKNKKWLEFKPETQKYCRLKERKAVLVCTDDKLVIVGYLRYSAGDKNCPYFVTPFDRDIHLNRQLKITHYCDCLGDDFSPPNWVNWKQTV